MVRVINLLERRLSVLKNRVEHESNRQIGNDIDEEIIEIKEAIKTLSSDWPKIVNNIPDSNQINMESILQTSKTNGSEILSQVYFRKGANWVKTILMENI